MVSQTWNQQLAEAFEVTSLRREYARFNSYGLVCTDVEAGVLLIGTGWLSDLA